MRDYKLKKLVLLVASYSLLVTIFGCDAFVRKFTRKKNKENLPQEEMVLAPEEYKGPQMSKEEQYRQYFLFWKSWQDELIGSLSQNSSHKRQVSCAEEAIKNLVNLRVFLIPEKQNKLDFYINELQELKNQIAQDIYGSAIARNITEAERIKRNILRDFSYNKIKDYLA
jgi:hypothetical protein